MAFFWTIILVAFIGLEAATTQLVCIWFAGGALAALICALCSLTPIIQGIAFVLTTALLLIFTRKLVKRLNSTDREKTNVDALIGQKAVVVEEISNRNSSGSVKIRDIVWSARSEDDLKIDAGSYVTIKEINGVKLIVKKEEE